ncbi:T9SS type A sorting domain-containing protein [candidate division KSB1 bacterium]|nr:T9SS type A sorting domain-containing protein [candidate division KSB1 bacterium]
MKKTLILFALLSIGSIYAQTYYINIWSKGKATSIPVQEIQKINFKNIASAVGNAEITTVIKSFRLLQNYPNPFNPTTTIEYELPQPGEVTVHIFSTNGRLVKSFQHAYASPGSYSVVWDGKNKSGETVASGLYVYQVTFANSVISKKMLMVK